MTILLVDDHALVRAGLKRLLATVSHGEILEAANGRDALALLRGESPDLIVLDLNLPGLGGLELLRRMIQMGAGPILVLSMHAEPLYVTRALDAGATVKMDISDQFWGDRYGQLADAFGHSWSVGSPLKA